TISKIFVERDTRTTREQTLRAKWRPRHSRFLTLGAGVTPRDGVDAEGSVNPIAGFTFNKVISLV
ncbi:hypothetical protein, partial [Candidatus Binatus sp.]|uniref:hypothetical protein n=1 Tax=Candidatus Binatus sp. TaxID=2811406 RepID=UPI003C366F3A